ncbi:unnamed protein product [Mytilus edulis]|uniref:Fibrinogen C-terminal domain-containing protein n=1 Tax=Mytilus edulis TaxID=6550 RepID=A0A8S3VK53_MYTED|nr:unnamed protein product [Mytilus edulis]
MNHIHKIIKRHTNQNLSLSFVEVSHGRNTPDDLRVDGIMYELQEKCLPANHSLTAEDIKKDTQNILNNVIVYEEIVKLNKQIKEKIKWILKAAGICSMKTEDCTELRKYMLPSGVYTIYPDKYEIKAYCDMKTDGGGDAMAYHNEMKFSTTDQDNDQYSGGKCADSYGPWWHNGYSKKRSKPLSKDINAEVFWAQLPEIKRVTELKDENSKWGPRKISETIPYQNLTEEERLFLRNAHLDVDGEEENECESNTENNEHEKIVDTATDEYDEQLSLEETLQLLEDIASPTKDITEDQTNEVNTQQDCIMKDKTPEKNIEINLISENVQSCQVLMMEENENQEINGNQSTFFNAGITQYFDSEQMCPVELFSRNSLDDITSYIYYNEEVRNSQNSTGEESMVDGIMNELQGICLPDNNNKTAKEIIQDTQTIINSMKMYKEIVKLNKHLKDEIQWIIKGICGNKRVKDCTELKKYKLVSGVYKIHPDTNFCDVDAYHVYCDMTTDGGVGDAASKYQLTVGDYSGNAGDQMTYHNGMKFSTTDQDNDQNGGNCAASGGPWWHNSCYYSGLNKEFKSHLHWYSFSSNSAKTSVMMIRKLQ